MTHSELVDALVRLGKKNGGFARFSALTMAWPTGVSVYEFVCPVCQTPFYTAPTSYAYHLRTHETWELKEAYLKELLGQ